MCVVHSKAPMLVAIRLQSAQCTVSGQRRAHLISMCACSRCSQSAGSWLGSMCGRWMRSSPTKGSKCTSALCSTALIALSLIAVRHRAWTSVRMAGIGWSMHAKSEAELRPISATAVTKPACRLVQWPYLLLLPASTVLLQSSGAWWSSCALRRLALLQKSLDRCVAAAAHCL